MNRIGSAYNRLKGSVHTTSNKMIVYFSLLFIVIMTLVGAVTNRIVSRNLEEQMMADTRKVIEQTMINVDYYFTDIKTPMIMMARNPMVLRTLQVYNEADWPERITMQRYLKDYTRNITLFKPYIKDILLVGSNGFAYHINSADELAADYDFFSSSWLGEIRENRVQGFSFVKSYQSEYYLGDMKDQTVVSAVLNVRENQRDLGYVICNIDLEQFTKIFGPLSQGKGDFIYMVDREGEVIFHPDLAKVGSQVDRSFMDNLKLDQEGTGSFLFRNGDQSELIVNAQSKVTNWHLVSTVPYSFITEPVQKIRQIVYTLLAASVILVIVISSLVSLQITRPIKRLLERIKNVQIFDFNTKKTDYGKGEIAIIGRKFENMVAEINKLIQDVYVSNLKQKEAELKELQSRINPHFLYNTLQLVKAEAVFGNNREVSAIVTSLGEMLRYPMYNMDELVTLEEELNYVRYYLDIYDRRFEGKLHYNIEVAAEWLTYKMPKLIFQPIVENCIVHGFDNMERGGAIVITAGADGTTLTLEVRDNGKGMAAAKLEAVRRQLSEQEYSDPAVRRGIGLSNVNDRIKLKFGRAYGILLDSEPGRSTRVTIVLPSMPDQDN
ncbi:sensor histidine kinase [Paenibacillaceae bacterium WGS1546]|uniref:sensor histidine kinase n=1 Tax=Cohnella sp. WGS1546 TaxID=3366810 RepID=UPI00372D3DB7